MDALRRDDVERARRSSPEERARQLMDVVRTGIRLRRISLRRQFAAESDQQIERRLRDWLTRRG